MIVCQPQLVQQERKNLLLRRLQRLVSVMYYAQYRLFLYKIFILCYKINCSISSAPSSACTISHEHFLKGLLSHLSIASSICCCCGYFGCVIKRKYLYNPTSYRAVLYKSLILLPDSFWYSSKLCIFDILFSTKQNITINKGPRYKSVTRCS